MSYSLERIVRGKPMKDDEFNEYIWHSELMDKVAATVIARRNDTPLHNAQKYPLENTGAYIDTVI